MNIKYTLIAEVDDQEVAVLTAPTAEMIQEQLAKAEHMVDRFIEENYGDEPQLLNNDMYYRSFK